MHQKDDLRQNIIGSIILLYFLPLLLLCGYAVKWISHQTSWGLVGIGLCAIVGGSIALIIKIWQWESLLLEQVDLLADSKAAFLLEKQPFSDSQTLFETAPPPSAFELPPPLQQHLEKTERELSDKETQYQAALEQLRLKTQEAYEMQNEKDDLQNQLEQLRQELLMTQQTSRDQIKQKEQQLFEYSQTINDLRSSMEKKQQQVVKLESSVKDLTYEIKTLLQLSEIDVPSQPPIPPLPFKENRSPLPSFEPPAAVAPLPFEPLSPSMTQRQQDVSRQLKRCIDTAQKLTGAHHFGASSRFRDMPINSYALEQRRLFDSLQSENSNLLLIYSQKEDKLLFANNQTKTLLGWSPDKFIQDFPMLIQTSFSDWKKTLSSLTTQTEAHTSLVLKSRTGAEHPFNCLLGAIPTGIFKNHIIILLY